MKGNHKTDNNKTPERNDLDKMYTIEFIDQWIKDHDSVGFPFEYKDSGTSIVVDISEYIINEQKDTK